MRTALLFLLLNIGLSFLFMIGVTYFIVWIFSLGDFPNLDKTLNVIGTYTAIVFLLNLLFGFRKND